MTYLMTITLTTEASGKSVDEAKAFYQSVMNYLEKAEGLYDADFSGDLVEGTSSFTFGVTEPKLNQAVCVGSSALRSALHAAGAWTPGWPHCEELVAEEVGPGWVVRFARSSQELVAA